jgi:hypothetical protein
VAVAKTIAWISRVISWFIQMFVTVADATAAMGEAVGEHIGGIINFFKSIPRRINGALAGVPGMLINIGVQMINGLIMGIQTKIGEVLAILGNLGKQAAEAIASVLKVHSPSRVFFGIGENITAGLTAGIQAGTADALNAVSSLGNALIPNSAAVATVPSASGASNGVGVQNYFYGDFNVRNNQDMQQIMDKLDFNAEVSESDIVPHRKYN